MSGYETEQDVVAALSDARSQDGLDSSSQQEFRAAQESVGGEQAPAATAPEGTTPTEGATPEDTFTGLDPNSLPDDMLPYYRSMQADYTRKTQQIADLQRQYEALEQYGGVETATQALQWVESLQNPDNALALHRDLTAALQERGYSVGEAQAIATQQVQQAQQEEMGFEEEPQIREDPRVAELQQKVDRFESWAAEQERVSWENRLQAEMDRAEAEIVRANPHYTEADLEAVYNLAHSTGFDLAAADQAYKSIQSHILGDYIKQKGSVAPGVSGVPATGSADQQIAFKGLNDKALDQAVLRYLAEEAAASS